MWNKIKRDNLFMFDMIDLCFINNVKTCWKESNLTNLLDQNTVALKYCHKML